ncbi:MAG: SusD family [Bacteroidetes bacterium]|nr:SusD family [Bacteroidota bacterium]
MLIMKTKIIFLSLITVLSFGLMSCSDFLEEHNKTGNTESIYLEEYGIVGLVNSCYTYTRGWYGKEPGFGLTEAGTDLWLKARDNRQNALAEYDNLSAASSSDPEKQNACLDEYWEMLFSAVNACNTALHYLDLNQVISDGARQQYKGEIAFLRAFYYWHLVETWGPVPVLKEPVTTANTEVVRNSEQEVYEFMLADVNSAITNLASRTSKDGRVNLWAAKALKARLLLYLASEYNGGNYTGGKNQAYIDAAKEAQEVITGSNASFFTNYADCWNQANEDGIKNKEVIWHIEYSANLTENGLPYRLKKDANDNYIYWTQMVARVKDNKTGGNVGHLMFTGMWSNHTKLASGTYKVLDRTDTEAKKTINGVYVGTHFQRYSKGFCRYAPSGYLLDLFNTSTDQRYQASFRDTYTIPMALAPKKDPVWFDASSHTSDTIIYLSKNRTLTANELEKFAAKRFIMGTRTSGTAGTIKYPMYANADGSELTITSGSSGDLIFYGNNLFISLSKFDDWGTGESLIRDLSPRDAFVFRLSEMYLIKAEAELATGGDALGTLNALRDARAIAGQNNRISGAVTIQTILDERAMEFCGEQIRWFDLKRLGKLTKEYLADKNKRAAANFVNGKHNLRPIPQTQLDATTNVGLKGQEGKFWQNDNY